MTYKNKIFSVIFFFLFSILYGQGEMTALDVLKKASNSYNKKEYVSFSTRYILYLDYTTKKAYEQYNGVVLKKNGINYFKIKDTEFVSFKDCSLKINHEEKALIFQKSAGAAQESPMSISNYLKGFDVKFLNSDKDYFVCELKPAGKFSQIMLRKVIVHIKKADYSISKQIIYFIEKMETKNAKGKVIGTIPRLEITYSPRAKNDKTDNLLIKKENYFIEKDKKIILSKRIATYKLFNS
ncbi:hypothetical protein [Flavobacterium sp.]|uniref:hypothetical protein n=1 Tax=Flavobacterium sp. TaxID=239 RepID=UPI003D6BDFD0